MHAYSHCVEIAISMKHEAQGLSQGTEQLEKAEINCKYGNMALSQASDGQYQAASHKAKGILWHSMHKEQQNGVLHFAQLDQKYIKKLQRNSVKYKQG